MKKILFTGFVFVFSSLALNSKEIIRERHKVKHGETLSSISRIYGLKVDELIRSNPKLSASPKIREGEEIFIPVYAKKASVTAKYTKLKPRPVASTPDTPYSEEDLRTKVIKNDMRNVLASINEGTLNLDKPHASTEKSTIPSPRVSSSAADYPSVFNQYASSGLKMKTTRGQANYLTAATSGNHYLAFYNEVEAGTVVKVTNLMNQKSIFVKVIGKVPPLDASNEIVVKISSQAARDLGTEDEKFLVEIASYTSN